jgi:hypothetical protein
VGKARQPAARRPQPGIAERHADVADVDMHWVEHYARRTRRLGLGIELLDDQEAQGKVLPRARLCWPECVTPPGAYGSESARFEKRAQRGREALGSPVTPRGRPF